MRKFTFAAALGAVTFALSACGTPAEEAVAAYEAEDENSSVSAIGEGPTAQEWDDYYGGSNAGADTAADRQIALVSNMTPQEKQEYVRSRMNSN